MAPAASSQLSPEKDEAPTTPSNSAATAVGAAGMKARNRVLSSPTVAGASTSSKRRKASLAPIPSSVMVRPSAAVSAAGLAVAPSGAPSASRFATKRAARSATVRASSSKRCTGGA